MEPLGEVSGTPLALLLAGSVLPVSTLTVYLLITVSPLATLVSGGLNKHCFSRIHLPVPRPALSVLVTSGGLETYR